MKLYNVKNDWNGYVRYTFLSMVLCLTFFPWKNSRAAQTAIVNVEKAKIYADKQMSTPIGYIPIGTKVRVGEVPRNRGQVLPIIVSKRVAYIRIQDIVFDRVNIKGLVQTSRANSRAIFEKIGDELELEQNNRVGLSYSIFHITGETWDKLQTTANGKKANTTAHHFKIYYEQKLTTDIGYRVGPSYLMASDKNLEIMWLGLYGAAIGHFNIQEKYHFESSINFTVAPLLNRLEVGSDKLSGHHLGVGLDFSVVYYFSRKWNLRFDLGYNFITLFGMSSSNSNKTLEEDANGALYGAEIGIGASYQM